MRKYKMLAVMMAVAMVGSIYSPLQAAGYCSNGNGSNCRIVVEGNCLDGNCLNGNSIKDVLNNNNCNGGNSVNGTSESGSCSNEALVNNILNNIYCNNGNSVKGASDNSNCKSGNCTDTGSNSYNSGKCTDVKNNNCKNGSCADMNNSNYKGGNCTDTNCNNGKCSVTNNNSNSTNGGSCVQNGKVYKIVVGNVCQSVAQTTTEQPSTQVTNPSTEQPKTQITTEQPSTEQPVAEKPSTEQPVAEKPVVEQPSTGQEKTEDKTDVTKPENPAAEDKTDTYMSEDQGAAAASVLNLVNQNRLSAGLHSLKLDSSLCQAAQIRANEIVSSFSHTRPDGRKFSTVLTDNGIRFTAAGENIAWGQRSPEEVMSAWMNSDGHRANIMNQTYTKLGVGHVTVNGRQYWVQLFSY